MKLDQPDIAARLITLRTVVEKNAADLCRTTKFSANRWSQYETGERPITLAAAIVLKEKYGVSLDWIYFGEAANLPKRLFDLIERERSKFKKPAAE